MKYRIREFSPLWLITRAALPALAMADKLQRLPRKHGGLGLCPRLKTGSDPTSYAKIDVPMKREDK